jgi:hypothetical protein
MSRIVIVNVNMPSSQTYWSHFLIFLVTTDYRGQNNYILYFPWRILFSTRINLQASSVLTLDSDLWIQICEQMLTSFPAVDIRAAWYTNTTATQTTWQLSCRNFVPVDTGTIQLTVCIVFTIGEHAEFSYDKKFQTDLW